MVTTRWKNNLISKFNFKSSTIFTLTPASSGDHSRLNSPAQNPELESLVNQLYILIRVKFSIIDPEYRAQHQIGDAEFEYILEKHFHGRYDKQGNRFHPIGH